MNSKRQERKMNTKWCFTHIKQKGILRITIATSGLGTIHVLGMLITLFSHVLELKLVINDDEQKHTYLTYIKVIIVAMNFKKIF